MYMYAAAYDSLIARSLASPPCLEVVYITLTTQCKNNISLIEFCLQLKR